MALSQLKMVENTVDPQEIEHFRQTAATWWDESGPYKALHQLNPLRIQYIRDHIIQHFARPVQAKPLDGLRLLDIGCGGGLLCEPMARLGAQVTGIDATLESIEVAKMHAYDMNLAIDYKCSNAETEGGQYDVVLCMEIIEHVAHLEEFIKAATHLVCPGGLIFLSTLNRTWQSYVFGILAAEYVLGWVPRGTHQWDKFVKPKELKDLLRLNNVDPYDLTGAVLNPLEGDWKLSRRQGINYMLVGKKLSV